MRRTLIEPWQNPKGRGLLQSEDELYVLSECCSASITSLAKHSTKDGSWLSCNECGGMLEENVELWNTHVMRLTKGATGEAWGKWGLALFGLEQFKLEVTE